jgi:hypothetical protein
MFRAQVLACVRVCAADVCVVCVALLALLLCLLCDLYLSAFRDRGSLGRRVKCRCVPQPRWVGARPSAKGGRKVAGDGRERGGNPAAFVFVPRLGRVRLQ